MRFRQQEQTASEASLRLLALFAMVVVGLLVAVNAVLALIYTITFPFLRGYPAYFFQTNSALVLLFVIGGCWIESMRLREGGAHVARLAGGREAQLTAGGEQGLLERRFANVVQEMTIASGHEIVPAAWVLPKDDAINALAAGWGGDDAVVAVTRGALERLTRAELQGVVAHEFSHLLHGDTRLNMRLVGLVWGLQMIWGLGLSLWDTDEDGRRGFGALFGLGLMAVGSLGWLAGRLLQAAVSRQREFLADASAVKYTRTVDGLGGALRKIADQQFQGRAGLQSTHAASLAHLLLTDRGAASGWRALWHTHPPLAERLRRLYGHDVLPLAADLVAFEEDEADSLLRIAPAMPTEAPPATSDVAPRIVDPVRRASDAAPGTAAAPPDAHRHDPLQVPTSFDDRARERDALDRIERWHGPGEWQAAMLALAIGPAAGDSPSRWTAWQTATADLTAAASVRIEIEALGAPARRQVFTLLTQRARSALPAQRRRLWHALMQRWSQLRPSEAMQWRALALGLLLSPRWPPMPTPATASLERYGAAAHAATGRLAGALGVAPDISQSWLNAATLRLTRFGAAALRGPAAGLAPATPLSNLQLALRVRRITPMQRPLLLRAWLLAAEKCGLIEHAGTADALHLACLALDLPVPESLLR
jgi:Zn-dependent protease with chaperone function